MLVQDGGKCGIVTGHKIIKVSRRIADQDGGADAREKVINIDGVDVAEISKSGRWKWRWRRVKSCEQKKTVRWRARRASDHRTETSLC